MKKLIILSWLVMLCLGLSAEPVMSKATLCGHITDEIDGSPLIGVSIMIPELGAATTTDTAGYYCLTDLPKKVVTVVMEWAGRRRF